MNRMNKKIITVLIASTAVVIITGGTVSYGFQGVLASLGLLFLLTSAGLGVFMMRKARQYAKIVKHAKWINNLEVTPVSADDKKWIMKHLNEYFKVDEEIPTPVETVITIKDTKQIMNHLDEFLMQTRIECDTITLQDQQFILDNVDLLFDNDREEDRQTFTW